MRFFWNISTDVDGFSVAVVSKRLLKKIEVFSVTTKSRTCLGRELSVGASLYIGIWNWDGLSWDWLVAFWRDFEMVAWSYDCTPGAFKPNSKRKTLRVGAHSTRSIKTFHTS